MVRRLLHKRRDPELAPDEIFLDSSNLPDFDRSRLEGKLEKPIGRRTFIGIGIVVAFALSALVAQAANLEIMKGGEYAAQSENNLLKPNVLFAERGAILDRNGVPLVTNTAEPDGSVKRMYVTPGFGHLLGYVSYPKKDSSGNYYDTDITGLAGIEQAFNSTLAGQNGTRLIEQDALGKTLSEGSVVPAKNGQNITLSIDARVQQALFDSVKSVCDSVGFLGGAGVIMNAHTGEVLALVSYPEYDPNVLSSGGPASVIAGYATSDARPYLDRAVQGLYTPGSVVKPFEAAGALTDGVITPDTVIDDPGSLSIPNPYDPTHPNIFTGWKALGPLNVEGAIAWSSDIFFYTVGGGHGPISGLGIDRLDYWYRAFGLGSPSGINLPGEATGILPSPAWKQTNFGKAWNIGDTFHTAIGQYGMQVTPIALARATAAVANGGELVTPTILTGQPVVETSVSVDSNALATARAGMRLGVTSALSKPLNLSYVTPAAKTGTAQVGANNQYDNAWVEGFWPYDNPEYVFVVVLERGPNGAGEQGVNVMQNVFETLHTTAPEYLN